MPCRVEVTAPSRLHFGMFSFGLPGTRQFGGVGAMIDRPGLKLSIAVDKQLATAGPLAEETLALARRVIAAGWCPAGFACRIEVQTAPRRHVGLGSGTQLGLAIAAGIHALVDGPPRTPEELAAAVGRGQRSAIGLHGFARGGLLVEAGKRQPDEISPLVSRVELPAAWRFVLCCPRDAEGLSGVDERRAFEQLPPVPLETTAELWRLTVSELLPSAADAEFARFSGALFEFGRLAGSCFASRQGGTFASPRVARLVDSLRAEGVRGVAQSSWGPTLAALVPDEAVADALAASLRAEANADELDVVVASPDNRGARVEVSGL